VGTLCNEMKTGQVYSCEKCGLELKVVKSCSACSCERGLECCGEPLKLKE
jgi:hypothetical protein